MRREQWEIFKKTAKRLSDRPVPLSLIIDSPWIPGYLGISHLDYYLDPEVWFSSNLHIMEEYPEVIFFPSWWVEYGMAAEPSVLGAKASFSSNQPPAISPSLFRAEDVELLPPVNLQNDGFAALALHRYRTQKQRIFDAGYIIPAVAARGPLCTAAFSRGLNDFLMDVTESPGTVHKLLSLTTRLTVDWLRAQAEAIGETVEGILVLDDIVGLLSRKHYLEFAHPYLQQVFDAFPRDWVKVYHNDANIKPMLEDLAKTGFDVLNWGKNIDITEVRRRTGDRICLMGNVNPLETGTRGTPDEVKAATLEVLDKSGGQGLILSLGGGVSPGMPGMNIRAMMDGLRQFNARIPKTAMHCPNLTK
ncbi:MAG TPA: uroporphyrinogen decarboxylase family protein [Acidobacteriota bacterium]|nr:uroporphyrinogen decarboxylase family protein [Acidobacteriota bacterium]